MFALAQVMDSIGFPAILAAKSFARLAKYEASQENSQNKLLFHLEKQEFYILADCERSVNRHGN